MFLSSWLSWTFSGSQVRRAKRRDPATTAPRRRHTFRPSLETLEDRVTPSLGLSTVASFPSDGSGFPNGVRGVIADSSGNLYGTMIPGAVAAAGSVFEIVKGSGTITTLASFNGSNGYNPASGMIRDSSGNLYGVTLSGGSTYSSPSSPGDGTVFEVANGSGTITTLASFTGSNGHEPASGLVMDSSGNLYGTTVQGGPNTGKWFNQGAGTVFELANGSGTITTLASFNGNNGFGPEYGLIMDTSGNLYGTTAFGGAGYGSPTFPKGEGTIYELASGSGTITTLASFNGNNGAIPEDGRLVMDSSGNLYGNTLFGGPGSQGTAGGYGTVFELAAGSGTITTLAAFNGIDGYKPDGGLVMDSSGNLYGETSFSQYDASLTNSGTVFELAKGSGTITTRVLFIGSNGSWPQFGLSMDNSGNFYGTTKYGGANDAGTVFELTNGPSFAISGPTGVTAGTAGSFTLTALNADGTPNTGYSGTVQFTSSDAKAVLPGNLTISGGTATFNVTLETAKPQFITATDVNNPSMAGFDLGIAVSPGAASQVVFSNMPSSAVAGQALASIQASIEDAYGNLLTGDNSDQITVSVNSGPSSQLGGILTETVQGGTATFSNLLLNTSGSYTLAAVVNLAGGGTLGPFVTPSFAVASPVSLYFGGITYSNKLKMYTETVTLINTTNGALTGPMSLELTNLPSGVVLTDATGKTNGNPYIRFLTSGKTLQKNVGVSITLTFTAPSLSSITFGTEVVVGL